MKQMTLSKHQQGASITGVILIIIMLGLLGKFAVGVIPAYVGDYQLTKLVTQELAKSNAAKHNERQFLSALDQQLSINSHYDTNAKDIITFVGKTPGALSVNMHHTTENQYYGGTYVVNRFNKHIDASGVVAQIDPLEQVK